MQPTTEFLGLPRIVVLSLQEWNFAYFAQLDEIFLYVDVVSLGRCCRVCKQLRNVAESDDVWRHHVVLLLGRHFENPSKKLFKTLYHENLPCTMMLKQPEGWTHPKSTCVPKDEIFFKVCGDDDSLQFYMLTIKLLEENWWERQHCCIAW